MEKPIEIIDELTKVFGGYRTTAQAYIDFGGKCGYCGRDLVEDRHDYSIGTIDHLIPRKVFPGGVWLQENLILSCSLCNSLKCDYNPCSEGENVEDALQNRRDVLLQRAKVEIAEKAGPTHAAWWQVRMLLRGYSEK
jgi:5-methylcytosine-specific restriction endonuclease McrA